MNSDVETENQSQLHYYVLYNNNNIEKLSKYKDLEIETKRIWGMRVETVPVIVGANLGI